MSASKRKNHSTAKPQKKKPNKLQERLNARVKDYASMMNSGGPASKKERAHPGTYHQPGSFK